MQARRSGDQLVGKLRAVLILGINKGFVITICFDVHELRAAVYGRADLYRLSNCFARYRMRLTNVLAHARRSGD